MPTNRRRADARRRAWGRGPIILRFEPLEGRQLLSNAGAAPPANAPDLVGAAFDTPHTLDWGETFQARGGVLNRGNAPVNVPFRVDFYASPTPGLSATTAVYLGSATVPAGLQPGQQAPIDQTVALPAVPLSGIGTGNTIYVEMVVDPQNNVTESNKQNNSGMGQGYDLSTVTIAPHQTASLVGASLGVYPDQAQWGSTVKVTAQVANKGAGDAPATRARVVLTPAGINPGGPADVTLGSLNVPAIAANQTAVVSQDIAPPNAPPAAFAGISQYVLSVVQDADFAVNPIYPHLATQGLGVDMVNFTVALPADPKASLGPKPDLAPVNVLAPSQKISAGQTFQVTTTIQDVGNLDAGAYRVRFMLVGLNGDLSQGLDLGDANLDGLKAGFSQDVVQTLRFPSRLPDGVTMNSQARIAVTVDPENSLDESNKANNAALSNPVTLQLVNTDGTVTPAAPPSPAATSTTAQTQINTLKPTGTAPTTPPTPAAARAARQATLAAKMAAAKAARQAALQNKKFVPKPADHSFEHNLKVFPKNVEKFFKKLINKD